MLAKIAYSYVVATMGLFPRDETPLLSLMTSPIGASRAKSRARPPRERRT
jgi:hypothetical protein